MPVIFVDVVRSTELVVDQGSELAGADIDERLQQAEDAFRRSDDKLYVGPQEGDGRMMLGHANLAARLVRAAWAVQLQDGLDLRIGMAVGDIVWTGTAWTKESIFRGEVIHLAKRLESECPPGGVAINAGLYQLLERQGAAKLRLLCEPRTGTFRGLPGERDYYILRGPVPLGATPPATPPKRRTVDDLFTMFFGQQETLLGVIERNATAQERLAVSIDRMGEAIRTGSQVTADAITRAFKEIGPR